MNSFFINKLKPSEFKTIAYFTGTICIILGIFLLLPVIIALIYDTPKYAQAFLISAIITTIVGLLIRANFTRNKIGELSLKGALIFVFSIWGVTALFTSLPYFFTGLLGPLDAIFQGMSGITTTGFTLIDIQPIPRSIAFWEAFTQWIGGLGVILLIISVIPSSTSLKRLYFAEGRTEQMTPNIRHTSKIFIKLYIILTFLSILTYLLLGLPKFEALCYALTAIATGGFSIFPSSVDYFNTPAIEMATIIIMIVGSTNFILLYRVIKGNFKSYYKDVEVKTMFILMAIATTLITISLLVNQTYGSNVIETLRHALFQVVSVISSTGFTSTDVNLWPPFCYHIMIILMICGGGVCSTASGIKLYNVYLLFKSLWWEGQSIFKSKNTIIHKKIYHDRRIITITNKEIKSVFIYAILYIIIFIVSATIILIFTKDIQTAYVISASAIGNIGIEPEFINIATPAVVKIVMIIEFWIGRIGVWPILLLIVYEINKINGTLEDKFEE